MKKILPILVVGILVLSGLGAVAGSESKNENIISENIVFSQPIISENGNYVSLEITEATSNFAIEDKPALPVVTKTFTFPIGTKIDDVKVTFSDIVEKEITKPITPSPKTLPVSLNTVNKYETSNEILTYSDINVFPEVRYSVNKAAGLYGDEHVVFLTVSLYPDQYFPQQNIIAHAEKASIDIEITPPENPVIFGDAYDFLIIAPSEFQSALQTLVDFKNNLDPPVTTKLVTLDEIPSGVGVDTQEDIKYFIKDAIETWGITYLLLVGAGLEGAELFPVRYAWLSDELEDSFPSDLYYADIYDAEMNFSNWDADGDGRFCEWSDKDNVDAVPDVYLGKMPANNVDEVNFVVQKIINYKAHNKMTKKIFVVGGDTFVGNTQIEGEYANTQVLTKLPGYTAQKYWATTNTLTKPNIIKGFKSGVDFADFSGHGSPETWGTHPVDDEETWLPGPYLFSYWPVWSSIDFDLFRIRNYKKLPVVFYNSCSNSKYSKSEECIGWKTLTLNGGGIATFAASGIGYGFPGAETSRRMGWMEVNCFDELYNTKTLGDVWGNCIAEYHSNFIATLDFYDMKTMVEFAMFADPTLVIQDGDNPVTNVGYCSTYNPILEKILEKNPRLEALFQMIFGKILGL